jgi:hypothetical protein
VLVLVTAMLISIGGPAIDSFYVNRSFEVRVVDMQATPRRTYRRLGRSTRSIIGACVFLAGTFLVIREVGWRPAVVDGRVGIEHTMLSPRPGDVLVVRGRRCDLVALGPVTVGPHGALDGLVITHLANTSPIAVPAGEALCSESGVAKLALRSELRTFIPF